MATAKKTSKPKKSTARIVIALRVLGRSDEALRAINAALDDEEVLDLLEAHSDEIEITGATARVAGAKRVA